MKEQAPRQEEIYFFDPGFGDPQAHFAPVDWRKTPGYRAYEPVRLTVAVHADAVLHLPFAESTKDLVAPLGTPAELMGRWSDGSVRLRVRVGDGRHFATVLDGRFPAWVAEADPESAARGMLASNLGGRAGWRRRDLLLLVAAFAFAIGVYLWVGPFHQSSVPAPPPAPNPASRPSITPVNATPTPARTATVRWLVGQTDGEGVFLRASPHLSDKLDAWPDDTPMQEIGPPTTGEGLDWRHVRAPDGSEGWVPARYLVPET